MNGKIDLAYFWQLRYLPEWSLIQILWPDVLMAQFGDNGKVKGNG